MLKVLDTGLYTSIQDLGRTKYLKYGVPVSGAMDTYMASHANLILNNSLDCAVLECTQSGPQLLFINATQITICGADMIAQLNEKRVDLNKPLSVQANDVLHFKKLQYGMRTYIAVKNGFKTPQVLKSRSYYKPLTVQQTLIKDQTIEYDTFYEKAVISYSLVSVNEAHFNLPFIEVYPGPEFDMLAKAQVNFLLKKSFHIGINNRMAYQLQEPLANSLPVILTSSVLPGTVQLTPSGKLIILMRDAQTTGGYPRILQLTEQSINRLAQKKLNDEVLFRSVLGAF